MEDINILILSAGTRNFIVRAFKDALRGRGKVIAADKSEFAPALYEADAYHIIPVIGSGAYFDTILRICALENIGAVLSLIDPELSVLSEKAGILAENGVKYIGSDREVCTTAFDKRRMNEWLMNNGYDTVGCFYSREELIRAYENGGSVFPVVIKPVTGSASLDCHTVRDIRSAEYYLSRGGDVIIQEFIAGEEFGADVYVDMLTGKTVSVFLKKKILMRAGETDKAVSVADARFSAFVGEFAERFGVRGPLDVDIIRHGERYYITDVNPRFGGGYPFAHACGCDHVGMIVNNLEGKENSPCLNSYENGVKLMKYSDVLTVRGEEK